MDGNGKGSLDGLVAIVTGAGQGVGRGASLAMAKAGAKIVVAGRTESKLRATCALIAEFGGEAIAVACNVKDPADIARTVDAAMTAFGRIDILMNNAQEVYYGPLASAPASDFEASLDSGPVATFRFMQACYPHLRVRGGSIINLASGAGVQPQTGNMGFYTATKQAIRALTRAASCEWAGEGIRVNSIAPLAESEALSFWLGDRDPAPFLKTIPAGRIGHPEGDTGALVVFLAGPASTYITGATVPIDGGQCNFD
jgi:NAD(P)-dependent dehydrogenase (short-subunit alcohol dehydrogenase family)